MARAQSKAKVAPKPPAKKPVPPPRSAREARAEGEKPSETVLRYFRQIHRQAGMPIRPADEADLRQALSALDRPGKAEKEPDAAGDAAAAGSATGG
jgi:hypothetical protein